MSLFASLMQNIECRLKVSLPSDLGAALTDGVVLCHLANHVRPRSIPSIHVPSPAVVSDFDIFAHNYIYTFLCMCVFAHRNTYSFIFSFFPAQTDNGQVSTKCGELPRGVPQNWSSSGRFGLPHFKPFPFSWKKSFYL